MALRAGYFGVTRKQFNELKNAIKSRENTRKIEPLSKNVVDNSVEEIKPKKKTTRKKKTVEEV